ncbi:DUF6910 family protein [Blastococcus saxobsidens]|uniref:Uncharacterized protein n=1 Tax=Blastococcus saxobsidens TaxID=138336 RepID=A0A4Q7Y1F6_9ACTN|nr:hypothetical protein [Blastococcus saxobsidens]RZU30610.1 hypothetical protein BKA19_0230 [Blastococcus saxobsidens]
MSGVPRGHSSRVRVFVDSARTLRFDDGSPVTAASGVAPLGEGWLIAQDDSTIAAWRRDDGVHPVRVLPPVDGHDAFSEPAGTKHLKPDLEVACPAEVDGEPAVLLLGSGSSPRRMRAVLVRLEGGEPVVHAADLPGLYERVAAGLGLPMDHLNLEGASRHGATIRWFNRGNLNAGVRSASVDVPLEGLVAAVLGRADAAAVAVEQPREYELGEVEGVGLAVTDAIALPDGRTLLSAAAEDTPNAVDDGPVVATAIALLDGETVLAVAPIPELDGHVRKVEGLALRRVEGRRVHLLAVVDDDDPATPSAELELRVHLG